MYEANFYLVAQLLFISQLIFCQSRKECFPVNSLYFFKGAISISAEFCSASVHGRIAMSRTMRILPALLSAAFFGLVSFGPAWADGSAGSCLSDAELRDLVNSGQIVPQIYAFRTARTKTGGEVVRASLCPKETGLVYMITTLTKDGKLNRIDINAVTGRPVEP
jgi:hypothetical protein